MDQDKRYLMLPRGVLHMSALGRFGRFTLFHHLSHLPKHLPCLCLFLLVFGVWVCLLLCCVFASCFASVMESRILHAY